jgi:hypothetical protein
VRKRTISMDPAPNESILLDNGLILEISDESRKVAADRWLVKLTAHIAIEVTDRWFSDQLAMPATLAELQRKLGTVAHYTYEEERNFVDKEDKGLVLRAIRQSLLSTQKYYGRADFAARFIIMTYNKKSPY